MASKPKLPKRPTRRAVWVSRVNLSNFMNPEWVRKAGWSKEHVEKTIRECQETLRIEAIYTEKLS